ncbi:MAG: endolytic transglycosylase MltG [Anaerolineales bacterium]|nr:endolytic transglycosylase MltG [Anaerolineales bacterium]
MRRYHIVLIILAIFILAAVAFGYIPARASLMYGPPAKHLGVSQRVDYSARLLAHGGALTAPLDANGGEQSFSIAAGESAFSIAERLQQASLISDSQTLLDYLVYTGLDLAIQSGEYKLSPALSIIDIARALQDATPADIPFVILSGWRMEEIAASLPTSGLDISPADFLSAANTTRQIPDLEVSPASMEGFFYPDTYILPRETTIDQLLDSISRNFAQHITDDLRAGFAAQGLDTYQAVTLASIVQRESIRDEEQPLIASVFLNRLKIGMALGSDPTVQYALGYDSVNQTWWKNPLSLDDLKFDSPYNTYLYAGLPPAPIANPGLSALQSVAFPAESEYYYFRASCDNSGYHVFAVTLEKQISNACEQ